MTTQNHEPVNHLAGEIPLCRYCVHHAQQMPERIALLWYGRTICWREPDQTSTRLVVQLQRLGVTRGDRVVLFLHNCPQTIVAHPVTVKLGDIITSYGPLLRQHELRDQLTDSDAKILVTVTDLMLIVETIRPDTPVMTVITTRYAGLQPVQPACRKVLAVPPELTAADASSAPPLKNKPGAAQLDLVRLIVELADVAERNIVAAIQVNLDDVVPTVCTSGIIDRPRGAMPTHHNASYKTVVTVQVSDIHALDAMLVAASLSYIASMLMDMDAMLYFSAMIILLHRFDPLAVLQVTDRYRVVRWYNMTPMSLAAMVHPDAAQYRMKSSMASPCASFGITSIGAIVEQWCAFAGPWCRIYEATYDLSEAHTCDATAPADAPYWGWHGKIVSQTEVRIIDPHTGAELSPGQAGETTIRSPGVSRGYWQRDGAMCTVLHNDLLCTGDTGQVSSDGYLQWQGRIREMIKASNYSAFPGEAEALLLRHSGTRRTAVTPIPDPEKGKVVCVYVVPATGITLSEAELIARSRDNMVPCKVPRRMKFHGALLAIATGRMPRRLLCGDAIAA